MRTLHIAAIEFAGLLVLVLVLTLVTSVAAHGVVIGLYVTFRTRYTVQLVRDGRSALLAAAERHVAARKAA